MKNYSVSVATDYFTIQTGVYAETEELAEQYAKERLLDTAGLDCDDFSHETTIEEMEMN